MKPYLFTEIREDPQLRVVEHFTILRLTVVRTFDCRELHAMKPNVLEGVLQGSRQLGKHKINDTLLEGLRAEFQKLLYPLMAQVLEPHLYDEIKKFHKMLTDGVVGFEEDPLEIPRKED